MNFLCKLANAIRWTFNLLNSFPAVAGSLIAVGAAFGATPAEPPSPLAAAGASVRDTRPGFFVPSVGTLNLDSVAASVPDDARAVALLDARLHELIGPELHEYLGAAAARRQFRITVLPVAGLDDARPEAVRAALQSLHSHRPGVEGVLFVGNVKLPSFFMPRADIHTTRLWPRFFEDLDMTPSRTIPPCTVLTGDKEAKQDWPRVAGVTNLTVGEHDYDFLVGGKLPGAELWAAFLPVGFQTDAQNNYREWAGQLRPFFAKATAFHKGTVLYGRGLYLVSNDHSLVARARPVWEMIGPRNIELFALNEKGLGAFKNNPGGYQRADLARFASLDDFMTYAKTLPWMDEGWQSAGAFSEHMAQARRRMVWWNVHSNPELSLITWQQAGALREGGLIALLNGCSVGGFRQPGLAAHVDTKTAVDHNVLVNLVYGGSTFVAALGSTHDRVTDERATPLLRHLCSGGYLGMAHLLRSKQADTEVAGNAMQLREFQELLVGDPFADWR